MRLAVLADVHGNGDALRAVLTDLGERGGADLILVLGDIALLGPDPGEVVELLMARNAVGVYGNIDRFLLNTAWSSFKPQSEEDQADQTLCLWALNQLGEKAEAWMRALPFERELQVDSQRLLLVHGSPRDEGEIINADTPDDAIQEMMAGVRADLILLGHTHKPMDRTVDSVRLINPGSVGYPQGEKGTTRYALLTWDGDWRVEFRLVRYDVKKTIARLLTSQRPYRLWVAEMLRQAAHVPLETFE